MCPGMETDSSYEQKVMPDGHLNIDGFLCCYDVSQVRIFNHNCHLPTVACIVDVEFFCQPYHP